MADSKFEKAALAERETLTKRREEILAELATVDTELNRILRYFGEETVSAPAKVRATASTGSKAPRGENLKNIIDILNQNPSGLGRSELLDKLGVKGTPAEGSISQALMNAAKKNQIRHDKPSKKYFPKAA